ncbi:MAG: ATP-binding cassette domain-containing protein [bacterium]|nr:ATP-binding cassette domain-containing protein [bacterium]
MESTASGVELRDVSFAYGAAPALHSISLTAPARSITALFGPSGAGKTTLLRLIAGFERPAQGEIYIHGRLTATPTMETPPHQRGVGFCFQEAALWEHLRVREHLSVTLKGIDSKEEQRRRVDELLRRFRLTEYAERKPGDLSGGERKRLELARALAPDPAALLLDEPFTGLEEPGREALAPFIRQCAGEPRATLLVTHQRDEAFALAQRLVILHQGRVIRAGEAAETARDPQSRRAAELLGYRSFVEGECRNGVIHTPWGEWNAHQPDGAGTAGWPPECVRLTENKAGECAAQEAILTSAGHRVTAQWNGVTLYGVMNAAPTEGAALRAEFIRPPAWITME